MQILIFFQFQGPSHAVLFNSLNKITYFETFAKIYWGRGLTQGETIVYVSIDENHGWFMNFNLKSFMVFNIFNYEREF